MDSFDGSAPNRLLRLPVEILEYVISHLANRDIKKLRLTSRVMRDVTRLRLTRVFLSPDPYDIWIFRTIAQHETYRHRVTEIIYNDARFGWLLHVEDDPDDVVSTMPGGIPNWCWAMYNDVIKELDAQFKSHFDVHESYKEYKKLWRRQVQVINSHKDSHALHSGLSLFPHLRRVTITTATHGRNLRPLYETPMIRNLPFGFIYPIPQGWPPPPVSQALAGHPWYEEKIKNYWRGFRVVTKALAFYLRQNPKPSNAIQEFCLDTNQLLAGINNSIFDEPNDEYNDLITILQQPGFSRLDLSISLCWQRMDALSLRHVLAQASDLQHVSLFTDIESPPTPLASFDLGSSMHWKPLRTIFPVEVWSNLRHFGLSRFWVEQSDLYNLLAALPSTLRSVELSFLWFAKDEGSYAGLMFDVKDRLGWRERPPAERPRITVAVSTAHSDGEGLTIYVDRETEDFVYGDGQNPFSNIGPDGIVDYSGIGVERDAFEPAHERPNVEPEKLMDMGILRREEVGDTAQDEA